MALSKEKIKEIAEDLDCGMKCYYHKKTEKIITIIDFDSHLGADEEPWEDVINELDEHSADYFEIERMDTRENLRVMESFAYFVNDSALKDKLIDALNRPKPFASFKWIVDNSGEYRQKWFDFKNQKYIEWVEARINDINSTEEFDNE